MTVLLPIVNSLLMDQLGIRWHLTVHSRLFHIDIT